MPDPQWRYEWLFESQPPEFAVDRPWPEDWALLEAAWGELLLLHTPFVAAGQGPFGELLDSFRELEQIFIDEETLGPYYDESFRPENVAAPLQPAVPTPPARGPQALPHIVTLQAQLMEDAFYVLRLDRYANAPDNRGWMNLFRRWGRSPIFNEEFERLRMTFTAAFVQFYDDFIHDLPSIDQAPIPHPWDRPYSVVETRPRHLSPADRAQPASERRARRIIPGVYLDSGIREAGREGRPAPTVHPGAHGAGPQQSRTSLPEALPPGEDAGGSQSAPNE